MNAELGQALLHLITRLLAVMLLLTMFGRQFS